MIRGEINALFVSADEGEIAEVSAALAEAPEIRLQSAPTLADAVERLRHTAFDLILLDLSQDGTNSFASLEPLGREAPDLPVIMLGAIEDDPRAEEAIAHGAADYLAKSSLSPAQLRRSIRYARDRWRARAELIRGRESAVQSARLRSEFLGNMSYEIRTSLNAIVGMSRLLIDTRLGRDQREMVETMRQSADALLKIVEDILDFSKLAAGSISLDERDFELGAVVAGAIALSAETAQRQGLKLASFIDTEVPALLRGDAGRLCQVLINLLSNAVKFTPTGEVTLQVAKLKEEDGNVTLHFSVKDSGIGVPFAAQRELFQAFDRADAAATRQFGGSGLSLAICAQLVELMGGTIGLESVPGQGSLFWFTARLRRRQVVIRAVSQPGPILAGMRVLVFDESPATARLIQEQLQGLGVACDSAASAAGAIVALKGAAANAQPYDLALIEIAGSPPQGLTLARAVKRDRTLVQTRVVGIYAPGAAPDQRRTRAAGVAAMLAKPVGQGELVNLLQIAQQAATQRVSAMRREARAARERGIAIDLPAEARARARILLVEDSPVNRRVTLRILERLGFAPEAVANGAAALERLDRQTYDVVLMDCQMPELDGYSATRELRRRETGGRHTLIIGVTANALTGDREACLAAGMDDFLAKPVSPEDLAAMLEKWLRQSPLF